MAMILLLGAGQSISDTIKIVVPFAAGGSADQAARALEKTLTSHTKHSFIVEYKPGAGGQIGAVLVANQESKQTTLLIHSAAVVVNSLTENSPYQLKDFVPVARLGNIHYLVITNKNSHVNNVNLLLSTKEPIYFGSSGVGSAAHTAGEIFKTNTKQNLIHVPFKGESIAFLEILGNRISLLFASTGIVKGHSDVKVLAITGLRRNPEFPEVPTLYEQGVKGFENSPNWLVLLANPGADPSTINELQLVLARIMKDPAEVDVFRKIGIDVDYKNLFTTKEFLAAEEEKLSKLLGKNSNK